MNAETREYAKQAVSEARKARLPAREARLEQRPRSSQYGKTKVMGRKIRVTEEQIEEAWMFYCAGESLNELGDRYAPFWKVTPTQARSALNYRFRQRGFKLRSPIEGLAQWAVKKMGEAA